MSITPSSPIVPTAEPAASAMSANSMMQLKALLVKDVVTKQRNCSITEFFSHLIIIVILVLGYGLSNVYSFSPKIYAGIELSIPNVELISSPFGPQSSDADTVTTSMDHSVDQVCGESQWAAKE
jgi:hypothetical protein